MSKINEEGYQLKQEGKENVLYIKKIHVLTIQLIVFGQDQIFKISVRKWIPSGSKNESTCAKQTFHWSTWGQDTIKFYKHFFTFLKLSWEVRSPLTDVFEDKNSLCLSSRPLKSNGSKDFLLLSFRNNKSSYPRKQFLVENKS